MSKPCYDDSCDARGHCSVCGCHMLGSFPEYGFSSCPSVCGRCDGLPDSEVERIQKEYRKRWSELYGPEVKA